MIHTYGALKRSERPLSLHFCSIGEYMSTLLDKNNVHNWKVHCHEQKPEELFNIEDLVYLSPESPNVLEEIDQEKIYIIGTIVDHNKKKGLSLGTANNLNIHTVRLPLLEYYGDVTFNKSLNVNHVFSIMQDVAQHGNWRQAFEEHVPQRRGYNKENKKNKPTKQDNQTETELQNDIDNDILDVSDAVNNN
eukprot:TRINITY_DN1277_c0_g1_i5.p1 TRINITY_DN1277_c0_g1~~TRINITY_DN1277_c0_g1_i5.p1  ORF type:complete len:191 (+),score=40.85 TRINITY_DN1277_c0_g1_i5:81-653(+)